jgi:hypothetical protein
VSLSLPPGSHIAVNSIQQIVEEDVELIRIGKLVLSLMDRN